MKKIATKSFFKQSLKGIIAFSMTLLLSLSLTACGSDEPDDNENGNENNPPAKVEINPSSLAGKWMLIKDEILYSEVNPNQSNETIFYKGGSAPYYKYYMVSCDDEGVLSMYEYSIVNNSQISTTMKFKLDGKKIVGIDDNKELGTIETLDKKHSTDNLIIKWNKDSSPQGIDAPVISTYMEVTWQ